MEICNIRPTKICQLVQLKNAKRSGDAGVELTQIPEFVAIRKERRFFS